MREPPPEPWLSFFREIDDQLTEVVNLHCCGGFVVSLYYGAPRQTSDVDYLDIAPSGARTRLADIAGKGSQLNKDHGVYLDGVTVVTCPENYEERLIPMFAGTWRSLHLFALEAHDIALSKLERNAERDRTDIQYLARSGHLNAETLRHRYYEELRPYLANAARHDQTMELWLGSYWPRD